ncbi:MAG: hypothetical protein JHD07_15380 [Bradyrhizobium sp.]|nr:hypothetical protein [Bradyrhizobium sp.]
MTSAIKACSEPLCCLGSPAFALDRFFATAIKIVLFMRGLIQVNFNKETHVTTLLSELLLTAMSDDCLASVRSRIQQRRTY